MACSTMALVAIQGEDSFSFLILSLSQDAGRL
jgi:hypothetical protein